MKNAIPSHKCLLTTCCEENIFFMDNRNDLVFCGKVLDFYYECGSAVDILMVKLIWFDIILCLIITFHYRPPLKKKEIHYFLDLSSV